MEHNLDPILITTKEAATLLGMSPASLNTMRCRGQQDNCDWFPYIKMGKKVRYDKRVLLEYIAKNTVTEKPSR